MEGEGTKFQSLRNDYGRSENFLVCGIVAFLFLFDKHCLIIGN